MLIGWHTSEPLASEAGQTRMAKLGVRGTPTVQIAGTQAVVGGGGRDDAANIMVKYQKVIDELLKEAPQAKISAAALREANSIKISADFQSDHAGLRLHAVLTESLLVFPNPNGTLFHHQVGRKFLTPEKGVAVGESFKTEYELLGKDRRTDFALVFYLLDPDSGAVLQARKFAIEKAGAE